MYRYPPALAELAHGDAERAARIIAYLHDDVSVVVELFDREGLLLARTVTALTGCLEVTAGLVIDGSPLGYRQPPQQRTLGGQPALSATVQLRTVQQA
jgi:hypothetical protein